MLGRDIDVHEAAASRQETALLKALTPVPRTAATAFVPMPVPQRRMHAAPLGALRLARPVHLLRIK